MKQQFSHLRERLWNSSLRRKFCIVFGVSMLIVCAVNMVMFVNLNRIEQAVDSVYDDNRYLQKLMENMEDIQNSVYEYLNTRGTDELMQYYRSCSTFRESIDTFNNRPTNDPLLLREKTIRSLARTWMKYTEHAISAKRGRDTEGYSEAYEQSSRVYQYLLTEVERLDADRFADSSERYQLIVHAHRLIMSLSIAESILVLIFNLLVLLYSVDRFTKPLSVLGKHAEQVGAGNLEVEPLVIESNDEVGIVSATFNRMVESLRDYIVRLRRQMENEIRMKEENMLMHAHMKDAQMSALQARINPHFLYNTMNAGVQLAMMEDAEQTSLFLENVADYYRYITKKIGTEAWLEEEIAQLESYLYIMNTRYANEIDYQGIYPDEIPHIRIPSMVLQPLAENAIEHGIRGLEGYKMIRLSVLEEDDVIYVEIEDNGVGISQEKIDSLMQEKEPFLPFADKKKGIGLPNVISRLRLYCGREDAVSIFSDGENKGTRIRIRIPKQEEK